MSNTTIVETETKFPLDSLRIHLHGVLLSEQNTLPQFETYSEATYDISNEILETVAKRHLINRFQQKQIFDAVTFKDHYVNLSSIVKAYIMSNKILTFLKLAFDLIEKYFPTTLELQVELMQDAETDDEWILLDIRLQGKIDAILDAYDQYTDSWVDNVPWPDRSKIHLNYTIL